jgi:hypothetical protein
MSRYILNPPDWDRLIEFAIGWDPALETYFGQVIDPRDDGAAIVWVGALPPHYTDLDDLMRAVNADVAAITSIPGIDLPLPPLKLSNRVRVRLMKDRDNHFKAMGRQSWPGKHQLRPALDVLAATAPPPLDEYGNPITDEVEFEWDADHDDDDDEDEDERPSHSLAYPPIYVLRCAWSCPECRRAMYFYSLGCDAYSDRDFGSDEEPIVDFHFLRQVESVPDKLLKLLKKKCPSFYLDRDPQNASTYLMNHCQCGAKLDDDYVSGDVGAVFYPDTPDGYADFELFLLPIDGPMPVISSYTLGGGEYLDYDKAKPCSKL